MYSKTLDKARHKPEGYSHTLTIDTAFSDIDVLGHVNNLAIGRYYEAARARFQMVLFTDNGFYKPDYPLKTVLATCTYQYLGECHFPHSVTVASAIERIGNSSYTVLQALFQNHQCIGLCDSVMVLTRDKKPYPLPLDSRERMQKAMFNPQPPTQQ